MLSPIDRLEIKHFHHDFQHAVRFYSDALKEIVLIESDLPRDKQRLSFERILEQHHAYLVLFCLWEFSPYCMGLDENEWIHEDTAYKIARMVSLDRKPAAALDYINRVIDAASAFGLAERQDRSANKIVVRGTRLLDKLMTGFALKCTRWSQATYPLKWKKSD